MRRLQVPINPARTPSSRSFIANWAVIFLLFFCFPFLLHSQSDQVENHPVPNSKYRPGQIRPDERLKVDREIATLNLDSLLLEIGYPKEALENKTEGKVALQILVDQNGNYVEHIQSYSNHKVLLSAVEAQVKLLRFEPAIFEGRPIEYWVTLLFVFDLKDTKKPNVIHFQDRALICRTLETATSYQGNCAVSELWISGTLLTEIPAEVLKLTHLRCLDLSYSGITVISPQIQQLQELEVLILSGNDLTALPKELWALPKLRIVSISSNKFSEKLQKKLQKNHSDILGPKNEDGEIQW